MQLKSPYHVISYNKTVVDSITQPQITLECDF